MLILGTIPKDAFKPFFGFASVFYHGVELHFESDKIWVSAVNTANTTMVLSKLNIPIANANILKIDIDDIAKIAPKGDVILGYESNYVVFTIDDETVYRQPIMSDPKIKTPNFPQEMKLPVTVTLTTEKVGKIVELVNNLLTKKESSEKIIFSVNDGKFSVENPDKTRTFTPNDAVIEGTVARSMFSPDLIQDVLSHYKLFDTFTFQLGIDNPLVVTYTNPYLEVKALVAPRIENDDD